MKTETYKKVFIKSEADLPKEAGRYTVCKKSGYLFEDFPYPKFDDKFVDAQMWLKYIDYYFQPLPEQTERKTAEEILNPYVFTAEELGADDSFSTIQFVSVGRAIEAMEEYRNQTSEVSDEIKDINFIKWYSGMEENKIRNAFERYKKENGKIKPTIEEENKQQ